jgi:hypothetical protein
MRNTPIASKVRKRLLRAGFSRTYANRAARELQEHWEELVDEGLRNGLSELDAQHEASARVGSTEKLAQEFAERLQNSSWLARHPSLGFGLLALTLTAVWWVAFGSLAANICGLFSTDDPKISANIGPRLQALGMFFDWIRATSYVAVPWLCCYIAERFFCGWRPALWACLVIAIHNAGHFMHVEGEGAHGTVAWAYRFAFGSMPSLLAIISPVAVFLLYRAWNLRGDEKETNDSGPKFC